jgi:hypothetical protein
VYQGDLEQQDVDKIIQHLNAAKWLKVLETHSGKRVPCFKDKRFSDPATFREWPKKATHRP